jgi:hypothetical protein
LAFLHSAVQQITNSTQVKTNFSKIPANGEAMSGDALRQHTNSNPKKLSSVYKTIVMSVLLYGAESWVINTTIMNKHTSFHYCCARSITGHHIKLLEDGICEYPCSTQTLKLAKLLRIKTYIKKRKSTVSTYVQTTNLYQECKATQPAAQKFSTPVWWNDTILEDDEI